MFGKLLKYDFRSYLKSLLPVWGAILILSVVNGFTIPRSGYTYVEESNTFISSSLPLGLFVIAFIIMGVMTLVLTLQRFYQGLLGNEGYLMFTLPVSRSQLIGSKLLVSVVVQFLGAVTVLLSVLIIGTIWDANAVFSFISDAFRVVGQFFREEPDLGGPAALALLEVIVFMLATVAGNTLHIYAAISLGHLSSKHRVGMSVLAWVGLNSLFNIVGVRLALMAQNVYEAFSIETIEDGLLAGLAAILIYLIRDAICWAITEWVLKNRLNLE